MLDIMGIYNRFREAGYERGALGISNLELWSPLRDSTSCTSSSYRNACSLLTVPYAHNTNRVVQYIFGTALSQRSTTDQHIHTVDSAINGLSPDGYHEINLIYYKSINRETRAILKEHAASRATKLNCMYLISHPGMDVAAYKVCEDKFLVLTNTLNDDLLLGLFAMLWLHSSNTKATEADVEALLRGDTEHVYNFIISQIADKVKAAEEKKLNAFKQAVRDIFSSAHNKNDLENKLNSNRNKVKEYLDAINKLYTEEKQYLALLNTFESIDQDENFKDFLTMLDARTLSHVRTDDVKRYGVYAVIETRLLFWDKDDYNIIKTDGRSRGNYFAEYDESFIGFLDEIFLNGTYTLILNTPVRIYPYNNGGVSVPYVQRGRDDDKGARVANPHVYHYDCWGDNSTLIQRAFKNKDYVGAWSAILGTLSGVNVTDTPVMRKFVSDIFYAVCNTNYGTMARKDGTRCSLNEAYAEYKEAKKNEVH